VLSANIDSLKVDMDSLALPQLEFNPVQSSVGQVMGRGFDAIKWSGAGKFLNPSYRVSELRSRLLGLGVPTKTLADGVRRSLKAANCQH
jgi:hypothetical protein